MNYDVVGIGNALVDIQVQVTDEFLEKLSLAKGGMTLSSSENQSRILNKLSEYPHKVSSGGSAANTIHGIGMLGGNAYYLGRVADDQYGRFYTEEMKACGVGFPGCGLDSFDTGTSIILVTPDSQRTMVTYLGISASLQSENVNEAILQGVKMVYIEGYLWTGDKTRSAALKMAKFAKKAGIPIAFTLSDSFVADQFKENIIDFIRWNVDILFCNELEAKTLTGESDTQAAFKNLQAIASTLFLTVGSRGSLAGKSSESLVSVKAFPEKAVDTTGAGDLFAAGALYSLLQKQSLGESAIMGSYCAGQVITQLGARMPAHSHTEIEKILKEYRAIS